MPRRAVAFLLVVGVLVLTFVATVTGRLDERSCAYLGKIESFAVNSVTEISCAPLYVVSAVDGPLVLVGWSTHMPNEPVVWDPAERLFVSPAHGESFDVVGRVVDGPVTRPMHRCPTRVRDGELWVDAQRHLEGEELARSCIRSRLRTSP
jgi:hypothetical protein